MLLRSGKEYQPQQKWPVYNKEYSFTNLDSSSLSYIYLNYIIKIINLFYSIYYKIINNFHFEKKIIEIKITGK